MLALAHPAASCSATTQANLTGPPPFFEWPTFVRWSDLEGSAWYEYFSAVYENDRIPNGHFPLHVSSFWMLYTDQLHDVDVPSNPPRCPGSSRGEMARDGGYYTENNMYSPPNTAWIWHKPPYHAVESDASWIEVIHRKDPFGDEHFGAWFLSAKGSGVWLHAGKSISFDEHDDAYSHFGVGHDNEAMSRAAAAQGFDTVIFLKHKDNTNYPCGKEKQVDAKYMNVEVVAVKLKGTYACGTKHGSPSKDVLRAGWHSKRCDCSNQYDDSNCGRVLRSVFPPWTPLPPRASQHDDVSHVRMHLNHTV